MKTTKQGYELVFGTNYLGPFMLTYLLIDLIKKSAPSQIINLSSVVHYFMFWKKLVFKNGKTDADPYSASKMGNIMHARELAKRYKGKDSYRINRAYSENANFKTCTPKTLKCFPQN